MFKLSSRLLRTVLMSLLGMVAVVGGVARADLIQFGSTYSFSLWGNNGSGLSNHTPITFDGLWESFTRTFPTGGEVHLRILEQQTDLGGGMRALEIFVEADGDIFPVTGEFAGVNFGHLDAMDVILNVRVRAAAVSFLVDGNNLASSDFYAAWPHLFAEPWNGTLVNTNTFGGWSNAGGRGINGIHMRIVTEDIPVPTPTPLLLMLVAAWGLRRRLRG